MMSLNATAYGGRLAGSFGLGSFGHGGATDGGGIGDASEGLKAHWRRATAQSSQVSSMSAPPRRTMASSSGKGSFDVDQALRLPEKALRRIRRASRRPMLRGETDARRHVGLGLVDREGGSGSESVGGATPVLAKGPLVCLADKLPCNHGVVRSMIVQATRAYLTGLRLSHAVAADRSADADALSRP